MFTHITADVKESDDDYESPNSNNDGEGSGGDYESAADGGVDSDNDYEPPPSEPPDDLQHHQICAAKHSNSEYIGKEHMTVQGYSFSCREYEVFPSLYPLLYQSSIEF